MREIFWSSQCVAKSHRRQSIVILVSILSAVVVGKVNAECDDNHRKGAFKNMLTRRHLLQQCEECPANADAICESVPIEEASRIRSLLLSSCRSQIDERCCSLMDLDNWELIKACACSDVLPGLSSFIDGQYMLDQCCQRSNSYEISGSYTPNISLTDALGFDPFGRG